MSDLNKKCGAFCKIKREALGINQQEAAKQIGISRQHLSSIENNTKQITLKTLEKIFEYYNCDLDFKEF